MKLWRKLLMGVAGTLATLVLALGLWLGHYVWPQTDYAGQGTCSAAEIDKTYVAISEMHGWHGAAVMRVRADAEAHTSRMRTFESHVAEGVNLWVDQHFSKKHTAAFSCNHAYLHPRGAASVWRLPDIVAMLQRPGQSETEVWKLAQCLSNSGYSARFPEGYPVEDTQAIRQLCEIRLTRNIRWEKRYA